MKPIIDDAPNDPRFYIPYIEFYITNVCNLSCNNCNRFNNHHFSGYQSWHDYKDLYEQWSKKIRIQQLTVMGGEPLLNPTILDWVDGLNNFWNKRVQILTNGTRLNQVDNLYDRVSVFCDQQSMARNYFDVSLHNPNDKELCFAEIRKFLRGKIRYYHKGHEEDVHACYTYGGEHCFIDENDMRVIVHEYTNFYTAAVQQNNQGKFTLYDNDPQQAHQACGFAIFKCYHFVKAKLYKCGPVALFPEFDQQHTFDIPHSDRELMYSYKPMTIDQWDSHGKDFMNHIDDVIPQCKFCPKSPNPTAPIYAVSKKHNSVSCYD